MQAYFEVPRSEAQAVIDSFAKSYVDCEGRQVSVAMAGNSRPRPEGARPPKRKGPPAGGAFDKFQDKPRKGGRGQGGPRKRR